MSLLSGLFGLLSILGIGGGFVAILWSLGDSAVGGGWSPITVGHAFLTYLGMDLRDIDPFDSMGLQSLSLFVFNSPLFAFLLVLGGFFTFLYFVSRKVIVED